MVNRVYRVRNRPSVTRRKALHRVQAFSGMQTSREAAPCPGPDYRHAECETVSLESVVQPRHMPVIFSLRTADSGLFRFGAMSSTKSISSRNCEAPCNSNWRTRMNSHSCQYRTIGYTSSASLVANAVEHAIKNGWPVAAVVLDMSGHVVAAGRMDDVCNLVFEIACDKALTATLGQPSKGYFERMSSTPELTMGAANRPRLCAWEGGFPIRNDGATIGAIGVFLTSTVCYP